MACIWGAGALGGLLRVGPLTYSTQCFRIHVHYFSDVSYHVSEVQIMAFTCNLTLDYVLKLGDKCYLINWFIMTQSLKPDS